MRILITGANGMVGQCLKKLIPEALTPNSKELDLTDSSSVFKYFEDNNLKIPILLNEYIFD